MAKEFTMPVLHGAPIEYDVCTEWYTVEELKPISSHIGNHCIQKEANILTDWNIDALLQEPRTIHPIEIDSITSDSVYTHVTLNDKICHAKLDTGAQINMMTESLFRHIGKIFVTLMEKCMLYVLTISHFSFGKGPCLTCNLIQ